MENEKDRQAIKIDVRAAIFRKGKLLMIREQDGGWTLPGGRCDMRLSIRETAIQYVKKQTNTDVSESTVISVHTDRERGICRFLLLFTPLEESLSDSGVMRDYFCLGNIPQPLTDTIDEDQIYLCFDAYRSENWKTLID